MSVHPLFLAKCSQNRQTKIELDPPRPPCFDSYNQKYCDSPPPPNEFRRFLGSRSCNSIFLCEIEPDEIIKIISGFNNNKSSDLCVRAIKHARHEIAPVLTQLFNDCMYSGIFPDELKIAKVIPLFKSGKRHDLSNYRPISILPLFSKIFEKLIHV